MSYATDVTGWYQAVQFRNPTSEELATYVAELSSGATPYTVQKKILSTSYTVDCVNPIIQEYQGAFNRVPDQGGEKFWINRYGDGVISLDSISIDFANSPEFYSLYNANASTQANKTLVDAFYFNVLQRAPDAAGELYWINSGLNASQLLQAFSQSKEMTERSAGYVNSYQFGEMAGNPQKSGPLIPPSFSLSNQWSGISSTDAQSGNMDPPDNALAVGPANVISAENAAILISDLTGNLISEQSFKDFFPESFTTNNSSFFFDPRVLYDASSGRYVVVIDQGNTPQDNHIDIAVSQSSDLTKGWIFQQINTMYNVKGAATWADYPMVSIDQSNIYLSTVQYQASQTTEEIQDNISYLTIVNKTALYSGAPIEPSSPIAIGTNTVVNTISDPVKGAFLVSYYYNNLCVTHVDGAVVSPTQTIYLGAIDKADGKIIKISNATQPSTATLLDAGDGRVTGLDANNGHLYAVFEIQPTTGGNSAAVHWVDIDVSNPNAPTVSAQGSISGVQKDSNATTFNGSIAVDKAGDVIVNFTASSQALMPTDYFIYHKASDKASIYSQPIEYKASNAAYTYISPELKPTPDYARWGDYSSAVSDLNSPYGFWISNEFASTNLTWGTSIAHILATGGIA